MHCFKNLSIFGAGSGSKSVTVSISGIIALVLALAGAGVWSLAVQSLCMSATRTAITWQLSSWRPRRRFDPAAVKELLRFGRHLIGFNIVGYCAQYFDKLVIGHQIGSSALGLYSLSDRLMRLPLTNVSEIAGAVMFPALSKLQDSVEPVKRGYLRANRMIALLTFPMMLGLSALAEPAILVIYGDKWRGAVGIVQVLCFAGLAQSVYNTASWIFLSRGRPDILFRLGILSMLVRVAGVLIGMQWGLLGVAWAYVLGGYLCLLYPTWSSAGHLIGLRFAELLKNVAGPFYCAACMAAAIWLSDQWLFVSTGALVATGGAHVCRNCYLCVPDHALQIAGMARRSRINPGDGWSAKSFDSFFSREWFAGQIGVAAFSHTWSKASVSPSFPNPASAGRQVSIRHPN